MDSRRFEQQVRQYQHRLYGFAYYFLANAEDAADVVQDVLVRFWQHHATLDEARLLSWLLRVTRNACIDALRHRRSTHGALAAGGDELLARAPADGPLPDGQAEAADFERHLRLAVARLAEPYRSLIILREIQELSYEELCGALDLPMTSVKVYLHRARRMVREQLREVMHREPV